MAKEKDGEESPSEDEVEAEHAREEELEDQTDVEHDQAREDAAAEEQNVDDHRDGDPHQS